jgi:hypothetical protein
MTLCLVEPHRDTEEPGRANAQMIAEGKYFYNAGCLFPVYVRYVISRDNQFHLIATEDEFRATFAPIETANEALSYGLAVTGLSAYYDLKLNLKYEYFVDRVQDTHVEKTADGYLVQLYHYQGCGCGPHITSAVDLLVTFQGHIERVSTTAVYKNPVEDDWCVD